MLEIGNGINAAGIGDVPGCLGKFFYCSQGFPSKDIAIARRDGEVDIVNFIIGILKCFQCLKLWVLL